MICFNPIKEMFKKHPVLLVSGLIFTTLCSFIIRAECEHYKAVKKWKEFYDQDEESIINRRT